MRQLSAASVKSDIDVRSPNSLALHFVKMFLPNFIRISSIFLPVFLSLNCITATQAEETTELPTNYSLAVEFLEKKQGNDYFTDGLFEKMYTYVQSSPAFKNYTKQGLRELMAEIDAWEEPEHLKKNFPYYHAGYDTEDRPVWMAEAGKFNIRKEVELGKANMDLVLRYMFKAMYRIVESIHVKDTPLSEVRYASFLLDIDGFDLYQFSHAPTMGFILRIMREYKEVIREVLGYCMLINVNHIAQLAFNLMRPILGSMLERMEVYGTNKAKWLPMVKRQFPENVIPVWYGGDLSFKPIQIYG